MERDKNPILTKLALYCHSSSIRKKHNKCEEVINMELGGGNRANKGILESGLDNQRA